MDFLNLMIIYTNLILFAIFIWIAISSIKIENKYKKENDNLKKEIDILNNKPKDIPNSINLSYTQCDEFITSIIDDIWKNRYFINYRLREVTIIPSMDTEIAEFTKEVIAAISEDVLLEVLKYYKHEYVVQKITRQAQMLFIDYTNNFKPSTK